MCGIAGILSLNRARVTQQHLQAATDALRHRGPEGEGFWIEDSGTVALGHRRLCIIDCTPAAAQPMHYRQRYTIVYNGEIYNYKELRKELEAKGCTFTSQSDTEVLLAAYATWGENCLHRLDGAFAFALWDAQERTLFAARDRFGEKPFYFSWDGEGFVFASEMKGLWAAGIAKEVNPALLYNFLTIDYTGNPGNPGETFYQNIQKLPAGGSLLYRMHSNEVVVQKWYNLYREEELSLSDKEAVQQFTSLLSGSVARRLRSDVAIGTSLSGGLDSSAIVALCSANPAAQYSHKCFTASFPGFALNEWDKAATVAAQFGLQHYKVQIAEEDLVANMEKISWHQEEPFTSSSVLSQYKVYERAKREGVTVLLDGQGADEVLGGYTKYYPPFWAELFRKGELKKSGELQKAKDLGIKETFSARHKGAALMPHFAAAMQQTVKAQAAARRQYLNETFAFAHKRELYYTPSATFDLNGTLLHNTTVYGLEELLRLADRNSAAHAVEVRLPFLEHRLVEALFRLPSRFKIRKGWTKWLLRQSLSNLLPADIAWQKGKIGFEPPQENWMQDARLIEAVQEGKRTLVKEGVLHSRVLQRKVKPHGAHAAEKGDWKYWSASMLFR